MNILYFVLIILLGFQSAFAATCNGCISVDSSNSCRVDNSIICNILADSVCKKVSNSSGTNIFVPAKAGTSNWAQFYNNPPGGVGISDNPSCTTIAAGYCTSDDAGNDACGTDCGMGTKSPDCSNSGSFCSGTTHLGANGCGPCTGTLAADCSDSGNYCSGDTYTSSNGCGTCTGTKDCSTTTTTTGGGGGGGTCGVEEASSTTNGGGSCSSGTCPSISSCFQDGNSYVCTFQNNYTVAKNYNHGASIDNTCIADLAISSIGANYDPFPTGNYKYTPRISWTCIASGTVTLLYTMSDNADPNNRETVSFTITCP